MTKRPSEGSAEFMNMAMEQAMSRISVVMEAVVKRYFADGQMVGFVAPTFADLKQLPEDEAVQTIAQMLLQPFWRRKGFEFARKLVEGLPDADVRTEQLGIMEQSYA